MGIEEVMNFLVEKLKEALQAVEKLGGEVLGWFDKVFPPETRGSKINHWFDVALPYLIITAVFLTVVVCFRHCLWPVFCGFCRCVRRCCCCGRRVKMMKAPGRNCMMPRNVFDSNPKGYFRNLRVHPGDQLC